MSTRVLSEYCAALDFNQLPVEVVQQAKKVVTDYVGVCLYVGRNTPWGKVIAQYALDEVQGGKAPATVIGYSGNSTAGKAALANGTMALGIEYEDVHIGSQLHPYAAVVSSALAVAEKEKLSGRELITAIVSGYEVMARTSIASGRYMGRRTLSRGLYPTQVFGVLGAAAVTAKLLGLDAEKTAIALGLAGEQSAGTMQSHAEGVWSRRFHGGKAAENGITAGYLAAKGFIGPSKILEGDFGIYKGLALEFAPQRLTAGLGESYEIMEIMLKVHACCAVWHSTIDAVLQLREEEKIQPDDVEKITGFIRKLIPLHEHFDKFFPTIMAAQYSMPFCVTTALFRGRVTPFEFTDESICDKELLDFATTRVETVFDEHIEEIGVEKHTHTHPSRVIMKLKDGREFQREIIFPRGQQRNPQTMEELQAKFMLLARTVLSERQAREVYETICKLEEIEQINLLGDMLKGSPVE